MPVYEEIKFEQRFFKTSTVSKACRKTWNDYCHVSSMHGIKYIYDKDTSIYIRAIWAATVFVMFILANRMAYLIYVDFIEDPIRIIIESDHGNTAKLSYPAVTVCPRTLFNHSKANEFVSNFMLPKNLTTSEFLNNFDQTYGLVNAKFKYNIEKVDVLQAVMKVNNYSAAQFLQRTHWDCNDFFFRCRFQSKIENCSELFRVIKTYAGFCCSFNTQQPGVLSKQFKSHRHAMRHGLSFVVYEDEEMVEDTYSNKRRLQVFIHEAHIYPDEFTFQKLLYKNEELLLRTDPTETTCSREVWKRLAVEERKCALSHEIKLRFFPQYHRQNCFTECRSIIMQKVCGCAPFYLFREANILVCNFEHIPCLSDNYDLMLSMQKECKCVDSCEKVDFTVRLTRASIKNRVDVVDPFYDEVQANYTIVHIYMQSLLYRQVRRDIVWNIVSIAGNLGNCYSVFVGISALSVLQFLYYFTFVLKKNFHYISTTDGKIFVKKEDIPKH